MHVIGLIGGIASGKSAVAKELASLGAVVMDADAAAHKFINRPEICGKLLARWGPDILDGNGRIDRRAIADRVFSLGQGREELEFLEGILHPVIRQEFEAEIARLSRTPTPAVIIDAPLLLEAGWDEICDVILFVESQLANRQSRSENLRNWSPQEFARREAAQMPILKKRQRATHFLSNDGSLSDLAAAARQFWQSLA